MQGVNKRGNETTIAYFAVTDDVYQFPVAMGRTIDELGKACGYDKSTITKVMRGHARQQGKRRNKYKFPITFVKTEVEQGFWDEIDTFDDGGNPYVLFDDVVRLFEEFCVRKGEVNETLG